ncbi:MAG: hypothetical protein WCL23_00690 [Candidatus Moraniibacteriota bacterium]
MAWKLPTLDALTDVGNIISNVANITKTGKEYMEKLAQQQLGFELFGIGDLSDEAIVGVGLRTAAKKLYTPEASADKAFSKLDAFLKSLNNHQRIRLRRTIAKLVLTERHENVVVETKTDKDGAKTEKQDRRQVDYEYTADDPRVQFIMNMAKELIKPGGPAAVKDQLLAFDVILEKAIYETLFDKVNEGKKKAKEWIDATAIPKTQDFLKGILNRLNRVTDPTATPDAFITEQQTIIASRENEILSEARNNSWIHLLTTSLPGRILLGMIALVAILALGTGLGWKVFFGVIGLVLVGKYVIGWYKQHHP